MKKLLTVIVLFTFALTAVLAGCGGAGTATEQTSAAGTEATTAAAGTTAAQKAELEPVTLRWILDGGGTPKDVALVEEEMSRQLKDKINASVKLTFFDWDNYTKKLNVIIASGEDYDLCFTSNWSCDFSQNAAKGAFTDLTELLPKYGADIQKLPPSFVWDTLKVGGKLLAVPNLQNLARQHGVYVREDLAAKYGFTDKINSFETLEAFLTAVKNGEPGVIPYVPIGGGAHSQFNEMLTYFDLFPVGDVNVPGVVVKDDAGKLKVVNQYETDAYKNYIKLMRSWYEKGLIAKDALTAKFGSVQYKAGKYAAGYGITGPWSQKDYDSQVAGTPYKTTVYDLGGKKYVSTDAVLATLTAINAKSKNPERAMMLLNLMNTDVKLYNTLCSGVEGTHYVLKDNRLELPEGVTAQTLGYNPGTPWMFGCLYNMYLGKDDRADLLDKMKAFDTDALPDPTLGFSFNAEPVKTDSAQCTTVLTEFNVPLCFGALDVEKNYNTMIEKLKKAGADRIIAEKQKQIDAWVASKK